MLKPWLNRGRGGTNADAQVDIEAKKLGITLVVASIPAILIGGLLAGWIESSLRDVRVIAYSTIGFGLLLWWADARFGRTLKMDSMNLKSGFLIGVAQVIALIPGTSRSGITITMGRMLGFNADTAARFSFLLSIPIIAAAGGYGVLRMLMHDASIDWFQFALAVGLSAVAGWLCIAAFLALLQRVGLVPFVIYRLILGIFLLWLVS